MTEKARIAAKKTTPPAVPRADKADGKAAVLTKIAAMPKPYFAMGERLHAIIKASAPDLSPRLWYGMPGYARGGKVRLLFPRRQVHYVRFHRGGEPLRRRGEMQPSAFSLRDLTAAEEARIGAP